MTIDECCYESDWEDSRGLSVIQVDRGGVCNVELKRGGGEADDFLKERTRLAVMLI